MSQKIATKVPKCADDIVDRILHYGGFKDGLDYLVAMLESRTSTSIIITGLVGVGKTSLVREAVKQCDVICIWIQPYHFTDDFAALRYIATQLKLKQRHSLQEINEDLEERCLGTDKKIVIVLPCFEEFCRKRQSLLYCLTNLTQHGDNISLIGLTYSSDCTENLEKRVRSRINASFYSLKPPYRDFDEYVEFTSLLLGGHKIEPDLKKQLEEMYSSNDEVSIRPLKRLLVSLYTWKGGKLVTRRPVADCVAEDHMKLLASRLYWLTKPQLEMLKMAVYYSYSKGSVDFSLLELDEFAKRNHFTNFDSIGYLALRNATFLVKNSFFTHTKSHKMIDRNSTLTMSILPSHFKAIMMNHPDLHELKTDSLWRRLK